MIELADQARLVDDEDLIGVIVSLVAQTHVYRTQAGTRFRLQADATNLATAKV